VSAAAKVEIRALAEEDLDEADRMFRLAFGTFLGMPDPSAFMGDADLVRTRWRADPTAALGAYADGALVGSNFAARWGSFAFFGPLTVRPELWNQGVARALLEPTVALFERWGRVRRACSRSRRVPSTSRSTSASASGRSTSRR